MVFPFPATPVFLRKAKRKASETKDPQVAPCSRGELSGTQALTMTAVALGKIITGLLAITARHGTR